MVLKEKDQKNLDALIAFLETAGMRASLRGSAAVAKNETTQKSTYHDLDLNAWDAEEKGLGYRLVKIAMDEFLKSVGAKSIKHSNPVMATWCEGRWQFKYKETEFDIMYTPMGPRFDGYVLVETSKDILKDKEKKSEK